MDEKYRNEVNDIRAGSEFGCRHFFDLKWKTAQFHMHPHYEFYLFIQGKVQIIIEDESFDANPMDLFVFPPGSLHRAQILDSECPYERAYFYATRKAVSDISDDRYPVQDIIEYAIRKKNYSYHADAASADKIISLIDEFTASENEQDPFDHLMNRCRMNMLSLITCKILERRKALEPLPPERISNVIRYINDHICEPLTLEELADLFFISKYTLLHDFKSYANIPVHQYILYKRVLYAQNLMQQGILPGDAARQSGFNDYAGFYRAFVKQNSMTPKEYYHIVCRSGESVLLPG